MDDDDEALVEGSPLGCFLFLAAIALVAAVGGAINLGGAYIASHERLDRACIQKTGHPCEAPHGRP